jgi:hypothetical protein
VKVRLPGSNRGPDTRRRDICTRLNIGIKVAVVVSIFPLPRRAPLIDFFCRVSGRCPNTSRLTRRVAKHQKLLSVLGSIRKTDSLFFAVSIGLRIETTDFYLITARKMAQLVGFRPQSNNSRTYREITRSRDSEVKSGARSTRGRTNFVGFIVRGRVDFGPGADSCSPPRSSPSDPIG